MSSPFAAPLYSKPVQPEVMGKLDQLQIRMQALGATPDEIMAMLESWWRDDDDWGDEDRSRILRSSDVALRAMIDQVRREWDATR